MILTKQICRYFLKDDIGLFLLCGTNESIYIYAGPYAVLSKVQSQDNPLVRVQFAALPSAERDGIAFLFETVSSCLLALTAPLNSTPSVKMHFSAPSRYLGGVGSQNALKSKLFTYKKVDYCEVHTVEVEGPSSGMKENGLFFFTAPRT